MKKEYEWWITKIQRGSFSCLFNNYNKKIIYAIIRIYGLQATEELAMEVLNTSIGLKHDKILTGLKRHKPENVYAYIGRFINFTSREVIRNLFFKRKAEILFDDGVKFYSKDSNTPFNFAVKIEEELNLSGKLILNVSDKALIDALFEHKSILKASKILGIGYKACSNRIKRLQRKYNSYKERRI